MAEMLENKGYYRTQTKKATELITEVVLYRWGIVSD